MIVIMTTVKIKIHPKLSEMMPMEKLSRISHLKMISLCRMDLKGTS